MLLWGVFGSTLACGEVLGLEEAALDPNLQSTSDGGAGAGSNAGAENSGGSGGDDEIGGNNTGAGNTGGAPPVMPVCETYCATVMQNCTGAFAVYGSLETCQAVCPTLPEGKLGDDRGNTVHCRLGVAQSAAAEPSYYCESAGPAGNGECGSNCQALCTIAKAVCFKANAQWDFDADCHRECTALGDLDTYTVDPAAGMYAGDHVQCRLFHVSASALADADVHCGHVGGMPPCTPPPVGGGGAL